MIDNYCLLLKQAARIYKMHEAGRKEPFNIFTVLRKASDEVNLHSRFLHALLDHQAPDKRHLNLEYFLRKIEIEFKLDGARVRREYKNIDILISNDATNPKQAVVIENKIYAKDQSAQLQRYHDILTEEGYRDRDINLLYLTPDGRDPSKCSVGDLSYQTISYRDDLLPWLKCCQMHAYDEPELSESIKQYIHLILKLTGTDFDKAYRKELKDLLFEFASLFPADVCQDEDRNKLKDLLSEDNNFVLAHDLTKNISEDDNPGLAHLNEAAIRTKISLLWKLWCEIESTLEQIRNFPNKDEELSNISEKMIKKYVRGKKGKLLLYYQVKLRPAQYRKIKPQVHLGVELDRSASSYNIYFGVRCDKDKYLDIYNKLQNTLNGRLDPLFPSWQYADEDLNFNEPNRKTLKLISKKKERKKFVDRIADGLKEMWEQMEEAKLT